LSEEDREEETAQLYSQLEDAKHAFAAFADAVLGTDDDRLMVVVVAPVPAPRPAGQAVRLPRRRFGREVQGPAAAAGPWPRGSARR
jgi:hypothetical protein